VVFGGAFGGAPPQTTPPQKTPLFKKKDSVIPEL
jgi:hypothetical protein